MMASLASFAVRNGGTLIVKGRKVVDCGKYLGKDAGANSQGHVRRKKDAGRDS